MMSVNLRTYFFIRLLMKHLSPTLDLSITFTFLGLLKSFLQNTDLYISLAFMIMTLCYGKATIYTAPNMCKHVYLYHSLLNFFF